MPQFNPLGGVDGPKNRAFDITNIIPQQKTIPTARVEARTSPVRQAQVSGDGGHGTLTINTGAKSGWKKPNREDYESDEAYHKAMEWAYKHTGYNYSLPENFEELHPLEQMRTIENTMDELKPPGGGGNVGSLVDLLGKSIENVGFIEPDMEKLNALRDQIKYGYENPAPEPAPVAASTATEEPMTGANQNDMLKLSLVEKAESMWNQPSAMDLARDYIRQIKQDFPINMGPISRQRVDTPTLYQNRQSEPSYEDPMQWMYNPYLNRRRKRLRNIGELW